MSSSKPFKPGTILRVAGNKYFKVVRYLGGGGMGAAYEVADANLAGKIKAMKVLHPEIAAKHPHVAKSFTHECRALALLSHPSIVSVDDLGFLLDDEGREITPYYLMPFLNGESLRKVLQSKGRFSPLEALNVTYQNPRRAVRHAPGGHRPL